MWKLFTNSKRRVRRVAGWSLPDSLLKHILFIQRRCSDWMNVKSKKWTPGQTKVYLMVFCLSFVVVSSVMLWDPFGPNQQKDILRIDKIPVLPAIPHKEDVIFSKKDLEVITAFRTYLDSLQTTAEGRVQYDQLAKERPGFLDSLKIIEHILLR